MRSPGYTVGFVRDDSCADSACRRFSCSGDSDVRRTRPRKRESFDKTFSGWALRTSKNRAEVFGFKVSPTDEIVIDSVIGQRAGKLSRTGATEPPSAKPARGLRNRSPINEPQTPPHKPPEAAPTPTRLTLCLSFTFSFARTNGDYRVLEVDKIFFLKPAQFGQNAIRFLHVVKATATNSAMVLSFTHRNEPHVRSGRAAPRIDRSLGVPARRRPIPCPGLLAARSRWLPWGR